MRLSLTQESCLVSARRNHAERTHTLGGMRLQALRKQAGKTQLVVEADAELGSGYMQRIESGKVRQPERATLERIRAALEAGYSERREILALFGYLIATPLPTEAEIAWARRVSEHELHELPFPAYVLDCGQRLLAWNRHVPQLFTIIADEADAITHEHWSMLHLWFEPRYGITALVRNPQTFFPQMVHTFRHQIQQFGNEEWYRRVYEDLMRLPLFSAAWERANASAPLASAARAVVPVRLAIPRVGTLQFRIGAEPFTHDGRFRIVYLLPADPRTMQQCAAWAAA
jgi:transcriptional regulator with XRE-family HTH domain